MEKIFKLRWWDYSKHKFNIQGRVCLLNSTLFATLCVILVYLIHPLIVKFVSLFSSTFVCILAGVLVLLVLVDILLSCIKVGKLNKLIDAFNDIKDDVFENYDGKWLVYIEKHFLMKFPKLRSIKNEKALEKVKNRLLHELENIKNKMKNRKKVLEENDLKEKENDN